MMTYRHTPEMGEISGFGGGYESCCQDMLEAGVKWLETRSAGGNDAKLVMSVIENVYGVLIAESEDAKRLEKVILEAAKGEATGAQHQAVMMRLHYIAKNGWDAYVAELIKAKTT